MTILGEHIDYLGGTVLPFACDREVIVRAVVRPGPVELSSPVASPARYVDGVLAALEEAGTPVIGCSGRIGSSLPMGAGLSSSAALEAAVALAVTGGTRVDPVVLQRAEQLATGVPCGVMDQTAVLGGRAGHALELDCATGAVEHVPVPESIAFVVIDTGTRRSLDDGRYAQRRAEAEAGHPRRSRHAASEGRRVVEGVDALRRGDGAALGALLDECHASLRDDLEVSSAALDAAVAAATARPECHGARLVGAGFAGCVLALVDPEAVTRFVDAIGESGLDAFRVRAVDGASEVV